MLDRRNIGCPLLFTIVRFQNCKYKGRPQSPSKGRPQSPSKSPKYLDPKDQVFYGKIKG